MASAVSSITSPSLLEIGPSPHVAMDKAASSRDFEWLTQNLRPDALGQLAKETDQAITTAEVERFERAVGEQGSAIFDTPFIQQNIEKLPYLALKAFQRDTISLAQFGTIQLFWMQVTRSGKVPQGAPTARPIPTSSQEASWTLEKSSQFATSKHNPWKALEAKASRLPQKFDRVKTQMFPKTDMGHSNSPQIMLQVLLELERMEVPPSEKVFFLAEDNDSTDRYTQLSEELERAEVDVSNLIEVHSSTKGSISQRLNLELSFNVFGRVFLKGRVYKIIPSFSLMQAYINIVSNSPFEVLPVLGLSSPGAIRRHVSQGQREIAVGHPGTEALPEEADTFVALDGDFPYHDFYHACALLNAPREHVQLFLNLGERVLEAKRVVRAKDPDSKYVPLLQKCRETLIDLELTIYQTKGASNVEKFFSALRRMILTAVYLNMQSTFSKSTEEALEKVELSLDCDAVLSHILKAHFASPQKDPLFEQLLNELLESTKSSSSPDQKEEKRAPETLELKESTKGFRKAFINCLSKFNLEELILVHENTETAGALHKHVEKLLFEKVEQTIDRNSFKDVYGLLRLAPKRTHPKLFITLAQRYFFPLLESIARNSSLAAPLSAASIVGPDKPFNIPVQNTQAVKAVLKNLKSYPEFGHLVKDLLVQRKDITLCLVMGLTPGFPLTQPFSSGYTMLQYTVYAERVDWVKQLLKLGAQPYGVEHSRTMSPFFMANISGNDEIIKLLLPTIALLFRPSVERAVPWALEAATKYQGMSAQEFCDQNQYLRHLKVPGNLAGKSRAEIFNSFFEMPPQEKATNSPSKQTMETFAERAELLNALKTGKILRFALPLPVVLK